MLIEKPLARTLSVSGLTQDSKSDTANGVGMKSIAITRCLAEFCQSEERELPRTQLTQVRQHATEDGQGGRGLLVQPVEDDTRLSLEVFERPLGRDRHDG
jgi:hypothetical protein